ncbi:MAG: RagB/SusD family nutrient uptake outer membrane protein [Paludibacter sp.]|nr:RagB/SusD family nutrient uptake outer membrane protein [Paludibacter sp.]
MKINKFLISMLILSLSCTSCKDYLSILPENNQSSAQYWQNKEEVEAVLGAGYVKLRSSQEYLFLWGEARGNGIYLTGNGSEGELAAQKLQNMDILPTNALAKWDQLYTAINMANSVIKYGPSVVDKDKSFNINVMNSDLSEAYFQRSLAYFYLVRLWKDVPFVKEPYVNDAAPYALPKTDGNEILKSCLTDLTAALESAKEIFPESSLTNPMNTKGRATKWAIYSLIADINLWLGNYDESVAACDHVINSGRVGLISGSLWFTNFFPGNSNESIFELQFSKPLSQTNSFISWFDTNNYYNISPYTQSLFESSELDLRGLNASYIPTGKIWKYIGINPDGSTKRNSTLQNDQNWIIYRLADIYLMEAEAYIMKGTESEMNTGLGFINAVRNRAGISPVTGSSDQINMMTLLLEERQREFFAEGKNWFDLLRVGRRSGTGFKDLFINQVLQVASANNIGMLRAKLGDSNSWYLPIHADELSANPDLVQNPYYNNLGN